MRFTVLGGGVIGLSTGIVLEALGHETTLVAERLAYLDGPDNPEVSTNYAAASVYPVLVEADASQETLVRRSEATFEPFAAVDAVPVDTITHYRLSETEPPEPSPALSTVRPLDGASGDVPARPGTAVSGYVTEKYLVEMPSYVPLLVETYRRLGGSLSRRRVTTDDLSGLTDDGYVVNCTGYGSRTLFDDGSMVALKGHILEVDAPDLEVDFSYIYGASEYDDTVYMYPREEKLLFGGSHVPGQVEDGEWVGETPARPLTLDGEQFPERVYAVNRAIVGEYTEVTEDDVTVTHGYRPYREAGLRVERDGDVLHNYGHGGGGVSLSWWSALELAELVCDVPDGTLEEVATQLGAVATTEKRSERSGY